MKEGKKRKRRKREEGKEKCRQGRGKKTERPEI